MKTAYVEKYFLFALLAIVIAITLAIFYPFITVVVLAGAFAVVLDPLYIWIKNHITKGIAWLASLLTTLVFLIIICGPLFFVGTVVFNQAQDAYHSIVVNNGSTNVLVQKIDISINKIMPNGFVFDTQSKIKEVGVFLSNNIAKFFTATFNSILMFLLMVFTMFYLLKDGDEWKKNLTGLIPLSEDHIKEILTKLSSAINRILKGSFFIAITQGILVSIGFTIFGVPSAALWGVVAGIASFVPTLGTSIISVPAIFFLYFTGMHIQAVGLLIWSIVLVGMIDNLLSPYVISKNTEIPSLFILFSILGGISLIGPVGVLIGPLILSLLYSLISIYRQEVNQTS